MEMKELRRLSRADLLKLIEIQTRECERLQRELDEANARLEDRKLRVNKAGNIAKAALEVNGVMEAAQAAASQYLENVRLVEARTRRESAKLLKELEAKIKAAERREEEARRLIEQNGGEGKYE